jgi:hypothetical protein
MEYVSCEIRTEFITWISRRLKPGVTVLAKANNNLIDRPDDACGSQVHAEEAAVTSFKGFSRIFMEEGGDSFYTLATSRMGFEPSISLYE